MTSVMYVRTKAEDLKLGDMFAYWAKKKDGKYPPAKRILNIQSPLVGGKITVVFDDSSKMNLHLQQVVLVEVLA